MQTNLPTDLLRAFITVIDLDGYTPAATALGRTQSAISQQLRRLEALIGQPLLHFHAGRITLTDAARQLDPMARQMLRINDDIVAGFQAEQLAGWLKVGVPTDFSNDAMLRAISAFAARHPGIRIKVTSRLSRDLRTALAADTLDLALAIAPEDSMPWMMQSFSLRPSWAISADKSPDLAHPVPLIRHPDPCEYADRMRAALREAGLRWQTVLVSDDLEGLIAATRTGLGLTVLTPATFAPGLRAVALHEGLPALAPLRIGLFYKHARLKSAGQALARHLMAEFTATNAGVAAAP
jgi:DNA-binding transcriptional LysR family regulator